MRGYLTLLIVFCLMVVPVIAFAGSIQGKVTDASTGDPLPGANVVIQGTSLGAATGIEGNYTIRNVPPGVYTVLVSYLGYERAEFETRVVADEITELDAGLNFKVIEGQAVEVTAQLEGQLAAINQQVSSNQIVNVVSQERIQELPDDNAAESVGRLPGVAVRRSAGEGSRVNIRGMSPKYNAITVNGERIPSTGSGQSQFEFKGAGGGTFQTSAENRSVDLSVMSSEALAGIEIYKALTPAQDADAIGGTVNFVTGKAKPGLNTRLNVLGGYTGYHDSFENVKLNGSVSERFFDGELGVLVSGSFQRSDRSDDQQDISYNLRGAAVQLGSVFLEDNVRTRDRYNVNLNLDYALGDHSEFKLTNLFSQRNTENISREYQMSLTQNDGDYRINWSKPILSVFSSGLTAEHSLSFAEIDWGVIYTKSIDKNDFSYGMGFMEPQIFRSQDFIENEGPFAASQNTSFNPDRAWGGVPYGGSSTRRDDENLTLRLNMQRSFSLSNALAAKLQFGGKYRVKERSLEQTGLKGRGSIFINRYTADNPDAIVVNDQLAMINFANAFDPGNFYDGDHFFPVTLPHEVARENFLQYRDIWKPWVVNDGLNDYLAKERISAGYFQTELSWKGRVTFLGGARYEYEDNDYTGVFRTDIMEQYEHESPEQVQGVKRDTSGTRSLGEWFPQFHLKLGLLRDELSSKGLDLRLAYTRSITRPDFLLVTPRVEASVSKSTIARGIVDIEPTTSWNTDIFLTAYSQLGLFTVGYFHKDLESVIFEQLRKKRPMDDVPGYESPQYSNYFLYQPVNSNADNFVRGWEFEVQTNLSWLPSPLDGFVLYGNISLIDSEVHYPWTITEFDPVTFQTRVIDSTRVEGLPGQADQLINLSVGYDKGGFSGRISYAFQDETIELLTDDPKIDGYNKASARLDFSASYKITSSLTAVLNVNNILNRREGTFTGIERLITSESIYGTRSEFGLRYIIR